MPFTTVSDKTARMQQYMKALDYYIEHTTFPIVFVENSNTDISQFYKDALHSNRLEIITFNGNSNKSKGKGYGEALIIEHALNNSKMISNNSIVVKITGRLIVENIVKVLKCHFPLQSRNTIICSFNSDLTFPDSRLFIAPTSFLNKFLLDKERIDDKKNIYFEHILAQTILKANIPYAPFWEEPVIIGISGTTGKIYEAPHMTKSRNIRYKLMALHRYHLYSCKTGKQQLLKTIVYTLLRLKFSLLKIINKE